MKRVFHVGSHPAVAALLTSSFGSEWTNRRVDRPSPGDVIVIEAFADVSGREDVPARNAYSACKAWKDLRGVSVYVVVLADDAVGPQLARFVLVDGVLRLRADGGLDGADQLEAAGPRRPATTLDTLLVRFGPALESAERNSKALARLLQWEREDNFLTRLQDAETGLFDGPYTALKLDEEFRRSKRFHLPLSLVLLDIGSAAASLPPGPDRQALLAEVAALFLNECRDIDVLGRFTATTFLFLLPGTPPDGASAMARRLLQGLRAGPFAVSLQPVAGLVSVPVVGIADRKGLLVVAETCLERARAGQGVGGLVTAWE